MDGLTEAIQTLVSTSDENYEKFKEAAHKMREAIANGEVIVTPKTREERDKWLRDRAEEECNSYNAEIGTENETDGYNCDICKNKGMVAEVVGDGESCRAAYIHCKCMAIRSFIKKANKSGLKDVLKKYTFDKYEAKEQWQQTLKEVAIRFCKDDDNDWFFIGGQSGSGKSHLCTAICTYYLKRGKRVKYMVWRDDVPLIKAVVNDAEQYRAMITELKKVDVLYIDDLFKMGKDQQGNVPRPTVADINLAFEILNYRYNNKNLVTIISSERQIGEILDIDTATGGRINEMTNKGGYNLNIKNDPQKNYRLKGIVEL